MNTQASRFVQAFAELPSLEQAKVIDLIAEYYLANPRHRQAMLRSAALRESLDKARHQDPASSNEALR